MKAPKKILDSLTDEQKEKVKAAKTPQELLALAKEAGYVLSEEQLQTLNGGDRSRFCNDCECPTFCPTYTCSAVWG